MKKMKKFQYILTVCAALLCAVTAVNAVYADTDEPDPAARLIVSETLYKAGWSDCAVGIYDASPVPGGKSVFATSVHEIRMEYRFPSPVDLTSINTQFATLTFWIYISDVSWWDGAGQIELNGFGKINNSHDCSKSFFYRELPSGAPENAATLGLENGKWHKIGVNVSAGRGDYADYMDNINFMRIFNTSGPYEDENGDPFNLVVLVSQVEIVEMKPSDLVQYGTDTQNGSAVVLEKVDYTGEPPTMAGVNTENCVSAGATQEIEVHVPAAVNNALPAVDAPKDFLPGLLMGIFIPLGVLAPAAFAALLIIDKRKKIKGGNGK